MAAQTTDPIRERVEARIAAERDTLDADIQRYGAARAEQMREYERLSGDVDELWKKIVKLDDAGEPVPDELKDAMNTAHAAQVRAMNATLAASGAVQKATADRAALDNPKEVERRMETAQRLDALRASKAGDGEPRERRPSTVEIARMVLEQQGTSLHYRDITRIAIESGLMVTHGKTPEATVNAALSTALKEADTPFERVAQGVFALKATAQPKAEAEAQSDGETPAKPARKPRAKKSTAKKAGAPA